MPAYEIITGCELINCLYYKNDICTDEDEYVNYQTGEPLCRYDKDSIPKSEWDQTNRINNIQDALDIY